MHEQITGYLTWAVRMGCETEARITAVERAQEYADLNPEAPPIVEDYRPSEVCFDVAITGTAVERLSTQGQTFV